MGEGVWVCVAGVIRWGLWWGGGSVGDVGLGTGYLQFRF